MVRLAHHVGESAFTKSECFQHLGTVSGFKLCCFGFNLHAHAHYFNFVFLHGTWWAQFLANTFFHCGNCVEFVFAHVHYSKYAAVGEKEMWCECFTVIGRQASAVERHTFCECVVRLLQQCGFFLIAFVNACSFLDTVQACLYGFKICKCKFKFNNTQMLERVIRSGHIVIFECAQYVHNGVDFTNVGKELVSEAFTFTCAFNESTNVDHLNRSVNNAFGFRHL